MNLVLSEQQIFDYIKCPLRYDSVYNHKMATKNHPSLPELIKRVERAFFVNLMNGKVLSSSEIKRKWDRVCESNQEFVNAQKCLDGIDALMKMYRWAASKQIRIADIAMPYIVSVRDDNDVYEIKGETGAIGLMKDRNRLEIIDIDYSNRALDQFLIDMKLKYSLDLLAAQQLGQDISGVHIHHVKSDKDFFTVRSDEDMIRVREAIKNIGRCIKHHLFYPRETLICASCDMKFYCRAWRG